MEWNTIPLELLERILIFTASPQAVVHACRICKNWNGISADSHLWKSIYCATSNIICEDSDVDWKQKVADRFLIRRNVKEGRCVVRTLATTEAVLKRVSLDFDNFTLYKDHCLVNWILTEDYGSYGAVSKKDSHFINMVTEDVTNLDAKELLFVNHYVATSPSSYYGGATFQRLQIRHFEQDKIDEISFQNDTGRVNLTGDTTYRNHIKNYCPESNYIGFLLRITNYMVEVFNAETGEVIYSLEDARTNNVWMYDNFLVLSHKNSLRVVNILTQKVAKRKFDALIVPGFVTNNTVVVRTENKVILWNFVDKTETEYPASHVPMDAIAMIYNDMWVIYKEAKLAFYDMKDGTLINTLALRQCRSDMISLLSDGRLGVVQRTGCRVISFMDSEVNRKIQVEVLTPTGVVKLHEISAHELPKFFVAQQKMPLEYMISRIVSYSKSAESDERFVVIFAQDENYGRQLFNEAATKLLSTARTPTHVNTPHQGWRFGTRSVTVKDNVVDRVCGNAIIVREKKIDGRWQLVSL